ncbi:MAG: iron-containing alcohol dehydrogenase, partial [Rectinema sp.]|nr:iron-containing alcohol dehydrogenase [Rectinema sp.]
AGLGMVHGFAHPVGALTGLAHGLANAILLPFVMEAMTEDAGERLKAIGLALASRPMRSPEEAVVEIAMLGQDIGIPRNLREAGVPDAYFEMILADALTYRRRKASPRAFTDGELRTLLEKMFEGNALK